MERSSMNVAKTFEFLNGGGQEVISIIGHVRYHRCCTMSRHARYLSAKLSDRGVAIYSLCRLGIPKSRSQVSQCSALHPSGKSFILAQFPRRFADHDSGWISRRIAVNFYRSHHSWRSCFTLLHRDFGRARRHSRSMMDTIQLVCLLQEHVDMANLR